MDRLWTDNKLKQHCGKRFLRLSRLNVMEPITLNPTPYGTIFVADTKWTASCKKNIESFSLNHGTNLMNSRILESHVEFKFMRILEDLIEMKLH